VSRPVAIWKQLLLAVVILCGAVALWLGQEAILAALGFDREAQARREMRAAVDVPVIVASVKLETDELVFQAVGTGRAERSVMLRSEASGKVVKSAIAPGARFQEGETLLWLDDTAQRLALKLAETRLAEAERSKERYQRLQGSGAAAAVQLDQVRTAAAVAALEVEQAREALQDRYLAAPFDGVSGLPEIEVGDWVDSDVDIATFDDRSTLLVEFDLPEMLLNRLAPEQSVTASTPAYGDRRFAGSVSAVDSRVDPASRTARVRVSIPNDEDLLRPGASFTISMRLGGDDYPVVPELALQFAEGSVHVWRIRDRRAERVDVRLVRRRNQSVLVDGPLNAGDLVVIEGTQRLVPNRAVTVLGGAPEAQS
jgi:RND family efflux transporter MFP subunit